MIYVEYAHRYFWLLPYVLYGGHTISSYIHEYNHIYVCKLSWWRHNMETFSASQALCEKNSPVTGEFASQRPVTRSIDVFFDLCLNKRLSKPSRRRWFKTALRSFWGHCNVIRPTNDINMAYLILGKCVKSQQKMSTWWPTLRTLLWCFTINSRHGNSFKVLAPVEEIYEFPIFKDVAQTSLSDMGIRITTQQYLRIVHFFCSHVLHKRHWQLMMKTQTKT